MAKTLVIVESPAKAKTIEKFLGKSHYKVEATVGHVRDLPKSRLGVDIDDNFEPEYINIRGKGPVIKNLKKEAKKAKKVYLATDPDREGEAISWHLEHILDIDNNEPVRIEFNEITKEAIKKAIKQPRKVDKDLVDAQQARRVLDRLLGYQISPILWQKVRKGLSAGRVQSVTVKLICDREKEIEDFVPKEYWLIELECTNDKGDKYTFKYVGKDGDKKEINNEKEVQEILDKLKDNKLVVKDVEKKERKRKPPLPYSTSMLQQDAVNRLGFTTKKTMMIAQALYEGVDIKGEGTVGLISYIRTDSKRISEEARTRAADYINEIFGKNYLNNLKVEDKKSGKKVQDAHEAIRPTGVTRTPDSIKDSLSKDQYKLYNLIWRRFVASQMAPSVTETLSISSDVDNINFRATGSKMIFDGYTKVFNFSDRGDNIIPEPKIGDKLNIDEVVHEQKFTQPPARYTEASLVKKLEDLGIGRPSTYAPTIATIQARNYINKECQSLVPTELGKVVTDMLEDNFKMLMDIQYTADMEMSLDKVEDGELEWKKMVSDAYEPLKDAIKEAVENIEKVNMEVETDEICENCGSNMVIKYGRFGQFLACKNYPECKTTKPILEKIGVKCPKCEKGDVVIKKSKRGRMFYGCSEFPECDFVSWARPTGKKCEHCGTPMVEKVTKKETKEVCPNKECEFNK